MRGEDKTESGKWNIGIKRRQPMTKLQQAREAAERAQQAAKEAAELVLGLEKEAEPSVWVHVYEKVHYFLTSMGHIKKIKDYDAGPLNSFPDQRTAERVRDWLALMDRMRVAAGGYEWENYKDNHYIGHNIKHGTEVYIANCIKYSSTIYFPSRQSARDFIDSMTEHEKEVFKRGFPVY